MLKTTCIVNIFIQGLLGPVGDPGKQGPKGMKVRVSNLCLYDQLIKFVPSGELLYDTNQRHESA